MLQSPDAIPVYIGDDWSFAFSIREGDGNHAPVDLTGIVIMASLYCAYSLTPIELRESDGTAGTISAPDGQVGLGVRKAVTIGLAASAEPPKAVNALHLILARNGQRRTIAVWPLTVLGPRSLMPGPVVARSVVDPIGGDIITFEGNTPLFPVPPPGEGDDTNFDQDGNTLVPILG